MSLDAEIKPLILQAFAKLPLELQIEMIQDLLIACPGVTVNTQGVLEHEGNRRTERRRLCDTDVIRCPYDRRAGK